MDQLTQAWNQLSGSMTSDQVSLVSLVGHLVLGGLLSLYVRFLFRRFSVSASSTDSISRVFPLLTIITTAVIAVVKSSLALSLGLVGALSIVRFRAAIKEPEELVYLFLCIAVGLALGAEQAMLAIGVVGVATVFVVGMHYTGRSKQDQNLLLTISGDTARHFANSEADVFTTVKQVVGNYTLQRYDVENGRAQVRMVLPPSKEDKTAEIIKQLRDRLPECEMSYVNLNSTL